MHDIRAIRDTPGHFVAGWSSRGVEDAQGLVDQILGLDTELRAAQTAGQEALAKRNAASKLIGAAMGRKDMEEADRLKAEVETLKGDIASQGEVEAARGKALRDLLAAQKNLAADDVPDGEDEAGNVETSRWGTPRVGGPAKDHADLGEAMGLLDFEAAAKMSGRAPWSRRVRAISFRPVCAAAPVVPGLGALINSTMSLASAAKPATPPAGDADAA